MDSNLEKAANDVWDNGVSIDEAATTHGVSSDDLNARLYNPRPAEQSTQKTRQLLSAIQEQALADVLVDSWTTPQDLEPDRVKGLVSQMTGKEAESDWWDGFISRNPKVHTTRLRLLANPTEVSSRSRLVWDAESTPAIGEAQEELRRLRDLEMKTDPLTGSHADEIRAALPQMIRIQVLVLHLLAEKAGLLSLKAKVETRLAEAKERNEPKNKKRT